MKIKTQFEYGSIANMAGHLFRIHFIPYFLITVSCWNEYQKILIIETGWLNWEIGLKIEIFN